MKPFLHGRKALSVPALRLPPGLAASQPRPPVLIGGVESHVATASVEVVKDGDKVTRLVVTCACGEKIEIDCLYPAGV